MLRRAACYACVVLLLALSASVANAGTVRLEFGQLEHLVRAQSPGAQTIHADYERTRAERDEKLQWSNPELAYDREDTDISEEYQITLAKQFELPWVSLKRRAGWNSQMRSAELTRDQLERDHIAYLRSGYVTVQLNRQYVLRLQQLRDMLTDASHTAASWRSEGNLSGVEEHLVQMVVISLNATYQDAVQEQRETLTGWRASLGYSATDSLTLTSHINFLFVPLKAASHYAGLLDAHPGIQARQLAQQALSAHIAAERLSFIPSVRLYSGYKEVDSRFRGYVFGASMNLPLFNTNGATVRRLQAERRKTASIAQLYRSEQAGRIDALVHSIGDSQSTLAKVSDHFEEDSEALNSLLYSYEEGWMTLSELLNAIQVEVSGLRDYYDQLNQYYENLFELEAITGDQLVSF